MTSITYLPKQGDVSFQNIPRWQILVAHIRPSSFRHEKGVGGDRGSPQLMGTPKEKKLENWSQQSVLLCKVN